MTDPLLAIDDLHIRFRTPYGEVQAVTGLSYQVNPGETVAIVGESGSGKSVAALAILGLLPTPPARILGGRINFRGQDLLSLDAVAMHRIRGKDIAMVFQEPMTSLNPLLSIGTQLGETLHLHLGLSRRAARERSRELLALVGIGDGERRLSQYPHQLSGGMRQRVMIAMALSCEPQLLIADEPTTALDVTIQAQILALLQSLAERMNVALVIITHNLGVVARYADQVNVMYAGRIVESGPARAVYTTPSHPYTVGLLNSVPRLDRPRSTRLAPIPGQPPDMSQPPPGCPFQPRCGFTVPHCSEANPPLEAVSADQSTACWESTTVRGDTSALLS